MRALHVALIVMVASPVAFAEKGQRSWKLWGRGGKPGQPVVAAAVKPPPKADPEVMRKLTALETRFDEHVRHAAADPSREFDLLQTHLAPIVREAKELAAQGGGDPEVGAQLKRFTTKMANEVKTPLTGIMRVRESSPRTAKQNLSWTRRISERRYSDWGLGGLQALDHELQVGRSNLRDVRQASGWLAGLFSSRAEEIRWLSEQSGVELHIPTVADIHAQVDQAESELTTTIGGLKRTIIGLIN